MSEVQDIDPQETEEWLDSFRSVLSHDGVTRARFLISRLIEEARARGAVPPSILNTDYVNTIPISQDPIYPGNEELERRIRRILRWNAAVMVAQSNKKY
ncbi:MAG: hypothetical protein KDB53_05645, partial [Planctomycetes bacterium]|nr:hypothetical protein [Planctomycetota bacterium]